MKEIGSEFWATEEEIGLNTTAWEDWPGDKRYFMLGRTALYAILDDYLVEHRPGKAYLPSYCCHTMIEPFVRLGFDVDFYPVLVKNGQLHTEMDMTSDCDVALVMDYFGYQSVKPEYPHRATIIRDMTHALFCGYPIDAHADYLFASFRKWGAISGAAVAFKRKGHFDITELKEDTNKRYINMRRKAYGLKREYIMGSADNKVQYRTLFDGSEKIVETDYVGYAADQRSVIDASYLNRWCSKRHENAETIIEGLNGIKIVRPIFPEMDRRDVPLFVPVIVDRDIRNLLRDFLIENRVYCPVHWPVSDFHKISEEEKYIYDQELSLICDQRYGREDIERQIALIKEFEMHYVCSFQA